jgi:ABC-type oligopeptide transport system substrate-binding subunit
VLVHDRPAERKLGDWLATQLVPIRVRVDVRALDERGFRDAITRGDFDALIDTWAFSIASPLDLLSTLTTGSSRNRGGWTDVAYDALVGQLLVERKPAEAAKLLDQIGQRLESKETAVIPLGYPTLPFLLGKRVVSFAMTPFGDPDLVKIELATKAEPAKR